MWPDIRYKYVQIVIITKISLSRAAVRFWCILSKQNKPFSLRSLVNVFKKYGSLVILSYEQLTESFEEKNKKTFDADSYEAQ